MPIRGLQRHEARVDAVQIEAVPQAPIRLARRDREQPAGLLQRVEQLDDAVEQRLLDPPGKPHRNEVTRVIFREADVLLRHGARNQPRHRLDQAEADHPPADLGRRDVDAALA